jgi:hypothetical protein
MTLQSHWSPTADGKNRDGHRLVAFLQDGSHDPLGLLVVG